MLRDLTRFSPLSVGTESPPLSLTSDEGTWIKIRDFAEDTPEMTDEEKMAMAKKVAEEAIRKSREAKENSSLDEEPPTNP